MIESAFDADDCIEFEQSERRRRIVKIYLSLFQLIDERVRQRFGINFQSDCQRGPR